MAFRMALMAASATAQLVPYEVRGGADVKVPPGWPFGGSPYLQSISLGNGRLFATAHQQGLVVFNLFPVPVNPTQQGFFFRPAGLSSATSFVDVAVYTDNEVYMVGSSGTHAIDTSDPQNPVVITHRLGASWTVAVDAQHVYTCSVSGTLHVRDRTNIHSDITGYHVGQNGKDIKLHSNQLFMVTSSSSSSKLVVAALNLPFPQWFLGQTAINTMHVGIVNIARPDCMGVAVETFGGVDYAYVGCASGAVEVYEVPAQIGGVPQTPIFRGTATARSYDMKKCEINTVHRELVCAAFNDIDRFDITNPLGITYIGWVKINPQVPTSTINPLGIATDLAVLTDANSGSSTYFVSHYGWTQNDMDSAVDTVTNYVPYIPPQPPLIPLQGPVLQMTPNAGGGYGVTGLTIARSADELQFNQGKEAFGGFWGSAFNAVPADLAAGNGAIGYSISTEFPAGTPFQFECSNVGGGCTVYLYAFECSVCPAQDGGLLASAAALGMIPVYPQPRVGLSDLFPVAMYGTEIAHGASITFTTTAAARLVGFAGNAVALCSVHATSTACAAAQDCVWTASGCVRDFGTGAPPATTHFCGAGSCPPTDPSPFPPTPAPTPVPTVLTPVPTPAPPTPAPPTPAPQTVAPATPSPPTAAPPTPIPETVAPATPSPPTAAPPTPIPETVAPATPSPPTAAPPTPIPETVAPATPSPPTPAPCTPAPPALESCRDVSLENCADTECPTIAGRKCAVRKDNVLQELVCDCPFEGCWEVKDFDRCLETPCPKDPETRCDFVKNKAGSWTCGCPPKETPVPTPVYESCADVPVEVCGKMPCPTAKGRMCELRKDRFLGTVCDCPGKPCHEITDLNECVRAPCLKAKRMCDIHRDGEGWTCGCPRVFETLPPIPPRTLPPRKHPVAVPEIAEKQGRLR